MARVRAINPGFFLDDELADCEPLARILFAGLWVIADREGRLKDRPRRIKPETLPYDEVDVDNLLEQLNARGVIHRYEDDEGRRFIAIPAWHRYQKPHHKEAESTIPAPNGDAWAKLEASKGHAWVNVARSSSSSSSISKHASTMKNDLCPKCETVLAFEDGKGRCPVCDWRQP